LKKTGFTHFKTKNAHEINCKLQHEKKFIANLSDTKFLGLCLKKPNGLESSCRPSYD